jgi:hypothetical protein
MNPSTQKPKSTHLQNGASPFAVLFKITEISEQLTKHAPGFLCDHYNKDLPLFLCKVVFIDELGAIGLGQRVWGGCNEVDHTVHVMHVSVVCRVFTCLTEVN